MKVVLDLVLIATQSVSKVVQQFCFCTETTLFLLGMGWFVSRGTQTTGSWVKVRCVCRRAPHAPGGDAMGRGKASISEDLAETAGW